MSLHRICVDGPPEPMTAVTFNQGRLLVSILLLQHRGVRHAAGESETTDVQDEHHSECYVQDFSSHDSIVVPMVIDVKAD